MDQESRRSIVFAIKKLIGMDPKDVILIRRSQWAVVELDRKRDVATILKQEVVFDPVKSTLIVFRHPSLRPSDERVFEIRNIKYKEDL